MHNNVYTRFDYTGKQALINIIVNAAVSRDATYKSEANLTTSHYAELLEVKEESRNERLKVICDLIETTQPYIHY